MWGTNAMLMVDVKARDSRVDPYKPHIFRHRGRWYQWSPGPGPSDPFKVMFVSPSNGSWAYAAMGDVVLRDASREGKIIGGRVHHYGRD